MYTVENGKIVNESGVVLSLDDVVLILNGVEFPQDDGSGNCIDCGEKIVGEGYNNWGTCESCLEYDAQSESAHESEHGGHWQSYNEATSYGRGNW